LLLYRDIDYCINFSNKVIFLTKKIYKLSREQIIIIKKYIDNMLRKNFIKSSILFYIASILIIKKLDKNLRVCIDYKALNALTIKNRNVLLFIKETLTQLC